MDTIKVVCGIIFNEEKIFICKRNKDKSLGGYWEFPGGKIEENETHEEALKRELFEELEMEINVKNFICKSNYNYGEFHIELYGYECELINYNGKLIDHESFEWTECDDFNKYNMAPADIPIINHIKKIIHKKNKRKTKEIHNKTNKTHKNPYQTYS